jgi:phosphoribosylformylglycinamidine (FGAM) synthase PurS component
LNDGIQTEQLAREILDERKAKELKLCENNISIELNVEKQNRRESETKITKMIDERLFNLKLDLSKEKKIREESEDRY